MRFVKVMTKEKLVPAKEVLTAMNKWDRDDNKIAILNVEDIPYQVKEGDIIGHLYRDSVVPDREPCTKVSSLKTLEKSDEESQEIVDKILKSLQTMENELLSQNQKEKLK